MKKTTQELIEMMQKSPSYTAYLSENSEELSPSFMRIDRALASLLAEKNVKKADIIAKSGIETHYAYQIFSGIKAPTRDKVIMLCIGFELSVEETQNLLKVTGYPQLYSKNKRDNAILFGISKKTGIIDINNLLFDLNLEILV